MFITPMQRHVHFLLLAGVLCLGLFAAPKPGHTATQVDQPTLQHVLQAPFQPDAPSGTRINDFSAAFSQTAHIASLNRSKEGHGKVTVRLKAEKPAAFRWDYIEPEEQHIISNGVKLWVYLPENNRVMISDVAEQLKNGDDPLLFLRSLDNLERHFALSIPAPARAEDGAYLLTLTPKEESAYVSTLTLHIPEGVVQKSCTERFPIAGVTILDPNGNTTALTFSKVEVNTHPAAKRFNFSIPPGVEIVHPDPPTQI